MPYFWRHLEGRNFIMHARIAMLTALNIGRLEASAEKARHGLRSHHLEADRRHQ